MDLCFAEIQKNIFSWISTRKSPESSGNLTPFGGSVSLPVNACLMDYSKNLAFPGHFKLKLSQLLDMCRHGNCPSPEYSCNEGRVLPCQFKMSRKALRIFVGPEGMY